MQNEIADLTKDAKRQESLRKQWEKTALILHRSLDQLDLAEIDQLTFEEMNIHKDNDRTAKRA